MPKLKNSTVCRAPASGGYFQVATEECDFSTNVEDRSLDFRFSIKSKGGGVTAILFQLSIEDMSAVVAAALNLSAELLAAENAKLE